MNDTEFKYKISDMLPGIRKVFEENPYCVFGISSISALQGIFDQRDINYLLFLIAASDSQQAPYDLKDVELPKRDTESLIKAYGHFNNLKERWLWFQSDTYALTWDNRLLFHCINPSSFSNDQLLACYYNVLITDPLILNSDKWKYLFKMLSTIYSLSENDLKRLAFEDIHTGNKFKKSKYLNSYKATILGPLLGNISSLPIDSMIRLVDLLEESNEELKYIIKAKVIETGKNNVQSILSRLSNVINTIKEKKELIKASKEEALLLLSHLNEITQKYFYPIEILCQKLDSYEMINLVKDTFYNATIGISAGGKGKDACRFDSLIYKYCTDYEKSQIKKAYPLHWLNIPSSELSLVECNTLFKHYSDAHEYDNAFKWSLEMALRGSANAQNTVGIYLLLGKGGIADIKQGIQWLWRSARNGSSVAWMNLSILYHQKFIVNEDWWFHEKKCLVYSYLTSPDMHVLHKLDRYFSGWKEESLSWIGFLSKRSCESLKKYAYDGIIDAQFLYGVHLYNEPAFGIINRPKVRRWWLKASIYNHPLAIRALKQYFDIDAVEATDSVHMFQCGNNYSKLDNTLQNQDLSFYWYYKSLVNGYEGASNNLGLCYANGIGVDQNHVAANSYYLRAIEYNNNSTSYYNYGFDLFHGLGVKQDKELAKTYLENAAENGHKAAEKFLKDHYCTVQKDKANAVVYGSGDYGFLNVKFDDFLLYNDSIDDYESYLRLEFGGFEVRNKSIYAVFYANVDGEETYELRLSNVTLDSNLLYPEISALKISPGKKWNKGRVRIKGMRLDSRHVIHFTLRLYDSSHMDITEKILMVVINVDFNNKTIGADLIDL